MKARGVCFHALPDAPAASRLTYRLRVAVQAVGDQGEVGEIAGILAGKSTAIFLGFVIGGGIY